ncbi:MAG: transposase [Microgenomates group bacterium]|nr:transposase [Microgenomates group bacterium]
MKRFYCDEIFHIFNKSIAQFGIFKRASNCRRFISTLDYYNDLNLNKKFSEALRKNQYTYKQNIIYPKSSAIIKIISYCIMPDHYHLLAKLISDYSLSKYISDVENSYSRFFNIKFKRKGPLWQGRFKTVKINTDEQLLHVSRYIHLNPTTAALVKKPEDWIFSSYREFITNKKVLEKDFPEILIKSADNYKKFVENQKDYQRKLKLIQKRILD